MLRPFYDASVRDSRRLSVSSQAVVTPTGPGPGSGSGSEEHQDEHRETGSDGTITPKSKKDNTLARPAPSRSSSSVSKSATTTSSGRSRSVSATCSRRILMGIKSEESARPVVDNHGAGTHFVCQDEAGLAGPYDALSEFDQIEPESIQYARSADELLIRGIGDYTFRPGDEGIVGKGKFSTVYKVKGIKGEVYALKHTPLYPHHPLIAARLLREPTLLAQLPPHPCLIGVQGYIRTPDHVYLVEQLSRSHTPLSALEVPINVELAGKILDQLVSVVRDGLHIGGRVCHRDLKADNLLIDETGHILLLDLGLATHFSLSKPRLTTCCGSPAYHSPEIVDALRNPPGTRTYYGPELDIWCIGLTLLSLLTGRKYPIGTSHKFPDVMAQGVVECLMEADKMIEDKSYRDTGSDLNDEDWEQWVYVKKAIEGFMTIDGDARMRAFGAYRIGRFWQDDNAFAAPPKDFKTISFEKSEIKHPLPIYLSEQGPGSELAPEKAEQSDRTLWMNNPEHIGIKHVISYVKYLMRTEGILYHCLAFADDTAVIQCVLPLSQDSPLLENSSSKAEEPWSLSGLFARRAVSVPPKARKGVVGRSESGPRLREHNKKTPCLRYWMRIRCNTRSDPPGFNFSPLSREIALDASSSLQGITSQTTTATKSPLSIVTNISTIAEHDSSPQSVISPKHRPGFKLLNIKTSPLMAVNREHSYSSAWPCASLPDTFTPPGTPSTGSPWVLIELSDARAKDAMKKALSQERWQSLGLEPLVMASRSSSRAASRVRANWSASRQVSGDSSRMSSPLVTPMLELTEEDFFPSSRGRGRAAEGKRNTIRSIRDIDESIPRHELDPVPESNALHLERRSSSARPSPSEPSPLRP